MNELQKKEMKEKTTKNLKGREHWLKKIMGTPNHWC